MTETLTTINSYPTIEEKVKLFEENGIDASIYYDDLPADVSQQILFTGPSPVARRVARIANENGIKIIRLHLIWDYHSGHPHKPPRWIVSFLY